MLVGYMRVSKTDGSQVNDLQLDALLAAGVSPQHCYNDASLGRKDDRPGLAACLKEWLEKRLEELSEILAVAVGGFSVMDNHLHLLVRLDPAVGQAWSDEEVVRWRGRLFPPRDESRQPLPVTDRWVQWRLNRRGLDATREGMLQGFPLGSYVKLVDYTGRLFRQRKASISADLAAILERLGCNAKSWQHRMEKINADRLLGRFFATTRAKLREICERLGVRHVVNLSGCPTR
jgi:hypothetical protein